MLYYFKLDVSEVKEVLNFNNYCIEPVLILVRFFPSFGLNIEKYSLSPYSVRMR